MTTRTPLRYPGGKSRLTRFIQTIMGENDLQGGHYVEPYAGGAGIAVNLLCSGDVSHVHINDISPALFAFWSSVFEAPDELCRLIRDTPVTLDVRERQRSILSDPEGHSRLELGFATFFLNRTNRSGILEGGVIGGKAQGGKWKMDVRYNKDTLCFKVEELSAYADRVSLYNVDAEVFLKTVCPGLPRKTLIFLDPPYYVKSDRLYQNLYTPDDHARIAKAVRRLTKAWVISYDDVPEIRDLYADFRLIDYRLPYSAGRKHLGAEAIFLGPMLRETSITDPLFGTSSED